MDFSRIIAELLEEHDYVIVPGLGAFKAVHLPARFDEDGKKMLPPSKTLSFNADVKVNDGMVTGYLVHRMKLPVSRAQKLTGEFSDDVVYRLGQGETVVLEGLGTLVMAGSDMEFFPAGPVNEPAGSFGLKPVGVILPSAIPPEALNIRKESVMREPEDGISPPEAMIGQPADLNPAPSTQDTEFSQLESVMREPEDGISPPEAMIGQPEPANRENGDYQSGAVRPDVTNNPERGDADKRPKTFRPAVWLALLFLLALVASVWFFFKHKTQDQEGLKPTTTAIGATPAPGPAVADSLVQVPEPSMGDSTHALREAAPREPLYFLVGGSFQSRQNADTYISKMSGKGYHPVHLGQYGSYFIVAIDSFKTEREAMRAVNHFNDRHPDAGAWIFHRKTK